MSHLRTRVVHLRFSLVLALRTLVLADAVVYEPLAVGLRWERDVSMTTPDGRTFHGTMTREITGTEMINGKTYFVSSTTFARLPGMEAFTTYRRQTADGIYAINGFDAKMVEYLETALPLVPGATWRSVGDGESTTYTIVAKENLIVAGRKYEDCLKVNYVSTGRSPSGTYFLAPNVGNIRDSVTVAGVRFEFTLVTFRAAR